MKGPSQPTSRRRQAISVDKTELSWAAAEAPNHLKNGETSGRPTTYSFCTANPCPLSCLYPHPLDPRHKVFALHTRM